MIETALACSTMSTPESSTADELTHLAVRGMTCAACVGRVEKALRKVPGVADAQVNFATETAAVHWVAQATSGAASQPEKGHAEPPPAIAALLEAVDRAGYQAQWLAPDEALPDSVESAWSVWGPVTLGGGGQPAAGAADAVGQPPLLAGVGAVRAGHAGAVHPGRALLPGGMGSAQGRQRQHGPARGLGHLGGLGPVGVVVVAARRAGRSRWRPCACFVFRVGRRGDHPGAAGQGARSASPPPDPRRPSVPCKRSGPRRCTAKALKEKSRCRWRRCWSMTCW